MRILAFDTSTEWLSVAAGDGASWCAHEERAGSTNSERILPTIDAVLAQSGWRLADLDGIAFGAGPGAFTGVRIACSVAQGLAFGADLPLAAIPSLTALAQQASRTAGATRVCACLDARMREVYLACYSREGDGWRTERAPVVIKPIDVELPSGQWDGAGDGFAAYAELASVRGLSRVHPQLRPTARSIGELALPVFARGQGVTASEARPFYVRQRVALTASERSAGMRL